MTEDKKNIKPNNDSEKLSSEESPVEEAPVEEVAAEEADIQFAADLAAYFSRAKGNKRVPVVMVPTDNLQRIAGAIPGTLRHRDGKVLWANPSRAIKHIRP